MKFLNVHDVIVIGILALLFVYTANFLLKSIGLEKFTTTANNAVASA